MRALSHEDQSRPFTRERDAVAFQVVRTIPVRYNDQRIGGKAVKVAVKGRAATACTARKKN